MTINETRIKNLKQIILKDYGDSVHRFATKIGRNSSQFYDLFSGKRKFGPNLARKLEVELEIPEDILDKSPDEETIIDKIKLIPLYGTDLSSKPEFTDKTGNIFALEKSIIENHDWKTDTLFGLIMDGEEMSPTIAHNSKVIVDTSQTAIESGKIYALSKNKEIFIRRVLRQVGSTTYVAKSDNEKYGKIDFKPGSTIKVIGRVVYLLGQEI